MVVASLFPSACPPHISVNVMKIQSSRKIRGDKKNTPDLYHVDGNTKRTEQRSRVRPSTCSLLLPVTAAISTAFTYANVPRAPRFLTSPRAVSARRPLIAASSPKAGAPAAVEIPEEYVDDIDAVNIALDVTQILST